MINEKLKFEGVALVCDTPTANGRVYPESVMREAVARYMQKPVRLGPLVDGDVRLNQASFEVTEAAVTAGLLRVECRTLSTPHGRQLMRALASRKMLLVPVGTGCVNKEGVVDQFSLHGFSLEAGDPAEREESVGKE